MILYFWKKLKFLIFKKILILAHSAKKISKAKSSKISPTPKKILLEPLREKDAKWLFLESLKYIYLNRSRKRQESVWFYWSGTSKCTCATQRKSNLHPFTGVAQVHFFGCSLYHHTEFQVIRSTTRILRDILRFFWCLNHRFRDASGAAEVRDRSLWRKRHSWLVDSF